MKRCSKCGKVMADRARFCPVCGMRAAEEDGAAPAGADRSKRKKKRLTREGRAVLFLLLLALVVVAILWMTGVIGGRPKLQSYTPAEPTKASSEDQTAPQSSPAIIEIPTLTGLTEEAALTKLTELGLGVALEEAGYDPAYGDGIILTQSLEPGQWANTGDVVRLTVNRLPLTLQTIWRTPRQGRFLLGNLVTVCRGLGTTNPNFTYTIVLHTAADDYVLSGGFRCLIGPNEPEPVSRLSANLLKGKQNIGGIGNQMVADDHIQVTFEIDDWTGFNNAYVESYEVTIASKADAAVRAEKKFSVDRTAGCLLMTQRFAGGSLSIEAPSEKQLVIRLTDDRLQNGYTCSPTRGAGTPLWDVKLFQASYKWIDVTVDGRDCASLSAMNLVTSQLFEEKSTKVPATPILGASYVVEGDTMIITVNLSADTAHNPFNLNWVEVTCGADGATQKMKLQ